MWSWKAWGLIWTETRFRSWSLQKSALFSWGVDSLSIISPSYIGIRVYCAQHLLILIISTAEILGVCGSSACWRLSAYYIYRFHAFLSWVAVHLLVSTWRLELTLHMLLNLLMRILLPLLLLRWYRRSIFPLRKNLLLHRGSSVRESLILFLHAGDCLRLIRRDWALRFQVWPALLTQIALKRVRLVHL